MNTEVLAISAVENLLASTDTLEANLNKGDKEPSWDGSVLIYKSKSKRKDEIMRVLVQVKGKVCDDFTKKTIKYQVKAADLTNYMNNGGVIFFVVYIKRNGKSKKIYYAPLLPVKIRTILKGIGRKQSTSIEFKEAPEESRSIEQLFKRFQENSHRQSSYMQYKLSSIDELIEKGVLESITLSSIDPAANDSNPFQSFFDSELYGYAKIQGVEPLQPLELSHIEFRASGNITGKVCIGDIEYYNSYSIIHTRQEKQITIGNSLLIRLHPDSRSSTLHYRLRGNLNARINDVTFMRDVLYSGSFELGGQKLTLEATAQEQLGFSTSELNEELDRLKRAKAVLDVLRISSEIDLDNLTSNDWGWLNLLYIALVEGRTINNFKKPLNPVILVNIGNLKIVVAATPAPGGYQLQDFFTTELPSYVLDDLDKRHPVSQYQLFGRDEFSSLSNIDFSVVVASLKKFKNYELTNHILLEMLHAYDMKQSPALFSAIDELSRWLLEESPNESIAYATRLINRLQVIKREREFTKEEIRELIAIVELKDTSHEHKVGAYLLLDNYLAAEVHLEQLDERAREVLVKCPIFKFNNSAI